MSQALQPAHPPAKVLDKVVPDPLPIPEPPINLRDLLERTLRTFVVAYLAVWTTVLDGDVDQFWSYAAFGGAAATAIVAGLMGLSVLPGPWALTGVWASVERAIRTFIQTYVGVWVGASQGVPILSEFFDADTLNAAAVAAVLSLVAYFGIAPVARTPR